jgi:hypothetical protein
MMPECASADGRADAAAVATSAAFAERRGGRLDEARRCCLHINEPDHVFDRGLKAEAERVAVELSAARVAPTARGTRGAAPSCGAVKTLNHHPFEQEIPRRAFGRDGSVIDW